MLHMYEAIKQFVRGIMASIAKALHSVSGGRVTANAVTWTGLLAHVPIAVLLANGIHVHAAAAMVVFGLFDTLDGELARLQKTSGSYGMFLDSVTDRIKEILIYFGLTNYFIGDTILDSRIFEPMFGWEVMPWAMLALGLSLLTTYLNAWGEVALSRAKQTTETVNSTLRGGFASYEIRIAVLALGVASGELLLMFIVISVLAGLTVIDRFWRVAKRIR
jgi:phosphatidylglycerophosphate synthase